MENETTDHFLLRCPRYVGERDDLLSALSTIMRIDKVLLANLSPVVLVETLLFGSNEYSDYINKQIIKASICFIISTRRFKKIEAYSENII